MAELSSVRLMDCPVPDCLGGLFLLAGERIVPGPVRSACDTCDFELEQFFDPRPADPLSAVRR